MIDKNKIINIGKAAGIKPEAIERDYVMNLILDAFARCSSTRDTFFFKGGSCVHKCFTIFQPCDGNKLDTYFTHGRFSSDIDLTVNHKMMNTDALIEAFTEVADYVKKIHGLIIDQFSFPIHQGKKKNNCRGYIHYQGPLYSPNFNSPKLKFDLTADERIVFQPYVRPIYHPYSNQGEETLLIAKTYTLRDMFAEKLRALFERCSPRDVYDIHVLAKHPDIDVTRKVGIGLSILEKFKLKDIPIDLRMEIFNSRTIKDKVTQKEFSLKDFCEQSWPQTLSRQVSLNARKEVTFDNYWNYGHLPEILVFANECVNMAQRRIEIIQKSNPDIDNNQALEMALYQNQTEPVAHFYRALQRLPEIPFSVVCDLAKQR